MGNRLPAALRQSAATVWTYIGVAVGLVLLLGGGIGVYDVNRVVEDRRDEELRRLQLNAERSAGQIESQLQEENRTSLDSVRDALWLRRYWTRTLTRQPGRIYAAVTDRDGKIVAHTRREHEGERVWLPPNGKGGSLYRVELVETVDEILTSGLTALDMRVPIVVDGEPLGVYHTGLDAAWLQEELAQERTSRATFWALLVSGMSGLLLLSSIVVVRVTRHTAELEHEIEAAHARRISEMHELVLGIAHEIRNPLNAIRLNLHSLGQVFHDEASLSDEEIATMLDEMGVEIARLETLMQEMLGFARSQHDAQAVTDVADEIDRTVAFLRANLERSRIEVTVDLPDGPCPVAIEEARLRQVLLNLLNNAIEAQPEGGWIHITARPLRGHVEMTVDDDGPGIPAADRERVFVPFFSTKATGTGLGLALARKFIEEAGGTIQCDAAQGHRGCRFRILLPAASPAAVEAMA